MIEMLKAAGLHNPKVQVIDARSLHSLSSYSRLECIPYVKN